MSGVKSGAKRALIELCKGLERSPHRNKSAIVTLMHEVGGPPSSYNISEAVFKGQLQYLLKQGVIWYRASELAKNLKQIDTGDGICVTFDDGTLSAFDAAVELIEAGANCTHFIIPERVNRKDGNSMHWSQIRELDSMGVEIGSHSLTHPNLLDLDDRALEEELYTSKLTLEDKLGKPITSFAYPYGKYDKRVLNAVVKSGYESAFTTRHLYASKDSDVFQIPRFEPLESLNHLTEIFQGEGYWFYRLLGSYYKICNLLISR